METFIVLKVSTFFFGIPRYSGHFSSLPDAHRPEILYKCPKNSKSPATRLTNLSSITKLIKLVVLYSIIILLICKQFWVAGTAEELAAGYFCGGRIGQPLF